MKSKAVASFWKGYASLPESVKRTAVKQYNLWLDDPSHPSVNFKKVGKYWSARVTDNYRVLGLIEGDTVIWFFIGSHKKYDRILK